MAPGQYLKPRITTFHHVYHFVHLQIKVQHANLVMQSDSLEG